MRVLRKAVRNSVSACAGALFAATMMAGCATSELADSPNLLSAEASGRVYRLAAGDKIKIDVRGESELSGSFEIDESGSVALPMIGPTAAQGRTIDEFRRDVSRQLADGFLKRPVVTVKLENERPVFIHGAVKNAGAVPFRIGLTFREAVALAGGYTASADAKYLVVGRQGQEDLAVRMPSDDRVLPGDRIRVPGGYF